MIHQRPHLLLVAGLLFLGLVPARASADVCLTIDEAHDTFSPQDRSAALLLLARQFELAGVHVAPAGCATPYAVSHVQLGATIAITLSGPAGHREATALGMEDVPAVYSQMVRSLLRGLPMDAHGIVDRTNVSAAQAATANRVYSDSLLYSRLGYGAIFGNRTYGGPSVGLIGYRREFDRFGIDVSFINFLNKSSDLAYGYPGSSGTTASWLKLELLHFASASNDRSLYLGAGLSWTTASVNDGTRSWRGSGLQGEITAGYELGRASTVRVFFQADVGLPTFTLASNTYVYSPTYPYTYSTSSEHRYAPSVALSMGLGWQHGGHR